MCHFLFLFLSFLSDFRSFQVVFLQQMGTKLNSTVFMVSFHDDKYIAVCELVVLECQSYYPKCQNSKQVLESLQYLL